MTGPSAESGFQTRYSAVDFKFSVTTDQTPTPFGGHVAKAHLTLPNGTTVAIEGTAEEVAALLATVSGPTATARTPNRPRGKKRVASPAKANNSSRKGPQTLLQELADEDWFKSKRTIGEVQKKLEEKGHIYAMTSLSTPLLRLTRSKVLRRLKDKSGWVYVS
jgi:hypothetical protein